jgi:hypothetical protein
MIKKIIRTFKWLNISLILLMVVAITLTILTFGGFFK